MGQEAPNQGQEDLFPTNPDLADILGRADLNFEKFYVFHLLDPKLLDFQVPDLQIPTFPGSQISRRRWRPRRRTRTNSQIPT